MASYKELKKIFQNIYIVKFFFHFTQCLYKRLELLFNIKMLAFANPKDIPN